MANTCGLRQERSLFEEFTQPRLPVKTKLGLALEQFEDGRVRVGLGPELEQSEKRHGFGKAPYFGLLEMV